MSQYQKWHEELIHQKNGTTVTIQICNYCGRPMPQDRIECNCANSKTAGSIYNITEEAINLSVQRSKQSA